MATGITVIAFGASKLRSEEMRRFWNLALAKRRSVIVLGAFLAKFKTVMAFGALWWVISEVQDFCRFWSLMVAECKTVRAFRVFRWRREQYSWILDLR